MRVGSYDTQKCTIDGVFDVNEGWFANFGTIYVANKDIKWKFNLCNLQTRPMNPIDKTTSAKFCKIQIYDWHSKCLPINSRLITKSDWGCKVVRGRLTLWLIKWHLSNSELLQFIT